MSTENNLDLIFKNSIKILTDLIAFKTISGEDNNSLINYWPNSFMRPWLFRKHCHLWESEFWTAQDSLITYWLNSFM